MADAEHSSGTTVKGRLNVPSHHASRPARGSPNASLPADPHFTVFVRLPFPRGDFQDPPPAAWLYERQLSQVKAQMRKVGKSSASNVASPAPDQVSESGPSSGGYAMKRGGSGGTIRSKESPLLKGDSSRSHTPTKPLAPPLTRTSSANTIQGIHASSTPRPQSGLLRRPPHQRPSRFETIHQTTNETRSSSRGSASADPTSNAEDSSSESDPAASNIRSQAFKRPPPFLTSRASTRHGTLRHEEDDDDNDDVEDDDDSPAFLPIQEDRPTQEPSSRNLGKRRADMKLEEFPAPPRQSISPRTHSSGSSASSRHAGTTPAGDPNRRATPQQRPRGPLSPRRTTELSGRSPGQRGLGPGTRPGSDGTPSMGSSFSDLDDTSVTQSALEEALLSNMQHGGGSVASRMSTISQALRSRYL